MQKILDGIGSGGDGRSGVRQRWIEASKEGKKNFPQIYRTSFMSYTMIRMCWMRSKYWFQMNKVIHTLNQSLGKKIRRAWTVKEKFRNMFNTCECFDFKLKRNSSSTDTRFVWHEKVLWTRNIFNKTVFIFVLYPLK